MCKLIFHFIILFIPLFLVIFFCCLRVTEFGEIKVSKTDYLFKWKDYLWSKPKLNKIRGTESALNIKIYYPKIISGWFFVANVLSKVLMESSINVFDLLRLVTVYGFEGHESTRNFYKIHQSFLLTIHLELLKVVPRCSFHGENVFRLPCRVHTFGFF